MGKVPLDLLLISFLAPWSGASRFHGLHVAEGVAFIRTGGPRTNLRGPPFRWLSRGRGGGGNHLRPTYKLPLRQSENPTYGFPKAWGRCSLGRSPRLALLEGHARPIHQSSRLQNTRLARPTMGAPRAAACRRWAAAYAEAARKSLGRRRGFRALVLGEPL